MFRFTIRELVVLTPCCGLAIKDARPGLLVCLPLCPNAFQSAASRTSGSGSRRCKRWDVKGIRNRKVLASYPFLTPLSDNFIPKRPRSPAAAAGGTLAAKALVPLRSDAEPR